MTGETAATTAPAPSAVEDGSPVPRRWLVVAGAAAMAGVMLIAVFSLGVWVGSGRDDPTAFAGLGAAGRPGGGPGQGAQGAPPGQFGQGLQGQGPAALFDVLSRAPDVVGQVQWRDGQTIGLNTPDGLEVVTLTQDTEVFLADGSQGGNDDLGRGRFVAVLGAPSADGRSLEAEELAVLPDRP